MPQKVMSWQCQRVSVSFHAVCHGQGQEYFRNEEKKIVIIIKVRAEGGGGEGTFDISIFPAKSGLPLKRKKEKNVSQPILFGFLPLFWVTCPIPIRTTTTGQFYVVIIVF